MHDQNDAYLRAISFGIASRVGKRFLQQLRLMQVRQKIDMQSHGFGKD